MSKRSKPSVKTKCPYIDDVAEEMLPICKQRIKILNREKAPRKAKQKKSIIKQEPTTPPIEANK